MLAHCSMGGSLETKIRVIRDVRIGFHSQYPEGAFEQPIPPGTVGIELSDPNGGFYFEILNQEIGIHTNGFPGDPVSGRLAATVSIEDAGPLAEKLFSAAQKAQEVPLTNPLPQPENHYNPDDYPKARILREPDVEMRLIDPADIEYPYPAGATGQTHAVVITALSSDGKTRKPALLFNPQDAEQIAIGIQKIRDTMPARGKTAITTEEKFHPERVRHY